MKSALLALLLLVPSMSAAAQRVALVAPADMPAPASHGLAAIERALGAKGLVVGRTSNVDGADFVILAGLASTPGLARDMVGVAAPSKPESLVIRKMRYQGKPGIALCGSDARGLMYAALDAAERISWSDTRDPFAHVRDAEESPRIAERGISIYTMHRGLFERRLHDPEHWKRYFDLLARSRINSFVLIFGYENGGFMAPPYPYFFDTPGFPSVRLVGVSADEQRRSSASLQKMIDIAHERGIAVTAAIWDHIYRGGVQGGGIEGASELAGKEVPGLVAGLDERSLVPYTKAALRRFLEVFPTIDALQFRMHGESGLKRGEMQAFWHDVFALIRERRPTLHVDLRVKDLPDAIIDDALRQGLKARVSTKYWMEQLGLPFHPTHVNRQNQHDRRHGYADLLRYPQRTKVHWQLWSGGTSRVLLWADPAYVRRFAESARLYGGDSFEVNEMLATWMLGEPHDGPLKPVLNPKYRYFDYEFERYWHFFQVWGRVAYDPNTPTEVWEREFERRFGRAGIHVTRGLHLSSQVLPRIVASSYRYQLFPTTRGWAEMMRQGDLAVYAALEGSDVQQFLNPRAQARSLLEGSDTAMRRPEETSRFFARTSDEILAHARAAEAAAPKATSELVSMLADLRILAHLAKYHAQRLQAAVYYNLYKETGDLFSFDAAIEKETAAVAAWEQIVAAAGDVYSEELAFGVHRVGFSRHWKEELSALRRDLASLTEQRRAAKLKPEGAGLHIAHVPVRRTESGSLTVRATVASTAELREVNVEISDGAAFRAIPMRAVVSGMYESKIPIAPSSTLRYFIEAQDASGRRSVSPAGGEEKPIVVDAASDREPPRVQIEPTPNPRPGEELKIQARVEDPSGVKWVRLRYRHLTQFEDYQTEEMKLDPATARYAARIPGSFIAREWDVMYFIEAVDTHGNGRMYPDLEIEAPYVVVSVRR